MMRGVVTQANNPARECGTAGADPGRKRAGTRLPSRSPSGTRRSGGLASWSSPIIAVLIALLVPAVHFSRSSDPNFLDTRDSDAQAGNLIARPRLVTRARRCKAARRSTRAFAQSRCTVRSETWRMRSR